MLADGAQQAGLQLFRGIFGNHQLPARGTDELLGDGVVEHRRTGFLYDPGSLPDFLHSVRWILDNKASPSEIPRAAVAYVACYYNRQRNLRSFADQFLARISKTDDNHAHPLLQQVRLSV